MAASTADPRARVREVAWVFLKLGTLAFGGPAAHVAMMRREIVLRRGWVSEREFLDAFAATSVIPGPGSTQLAIYLARRRAGWWGLVIGGTCFIAPAMAIVLAIAWTYVRYGSTPAGAGLLYGITPVVVAIIVDAVYGLGRAALRGRLLIAVALLVVVGYFARINVLVLLLTAGVVVMAVRNARRLHSLHTAIVPIGMLSSFAVARRVVPRRSPALGRLFLEFLKLGAIVFGSGYVLFAYLNRDLVSGLGWITPRELLDAIAVGQLTPGPVFTTATFVGYLLHGFSGALLATLGIFLPSFVLVAALGPVIPRLR
ncbi:MAG: chromate transporter, chromate ion transporter family, partial [Actinomycetia bacterium]|nr:chromate transporter, chromate ion transporter family [Actinomycetes bacterium]